MARTRKPTGQHKIDGTFRKDRHGDRIDAHQDFFSVPSKPKELRDDGAKLWDTLSQQLTSAKIVSKLDEPALAAMCMWWQRYLDIHRAMESLHIADDEADVLEKRANRAWKAFEGIAMRFGMTPADRAKLKQADTKDESDDNPLRSLNIVG